LDPAHASNETSAPSPISSPTAANTAAEACESELSFFGPSNGFTTLVAPNSFACFALNAEISLTITCFAPLAFNKNVNAHPIGPAPSTTAFCPSSNPEMRIICHATANGSDNAPSFNDTSSGKGTNATGFTAIC
jgi:hypothetical protein